MAQTNRGIKNKPTIGKKQLREMKRRDKNRRRSLIFGGIAIVVAVIGVIAFLPRPAAEVVSEARLIDNPTKGPSVAPVTITEFGDFNCEACRAWHEFGFLEQLQANYGDQVRIVWRDLPIITPQSPKAAEAAECAYDQGRFWDYHDLLFVQAPNLGVRNLKSYAVELGLDEDVFNQCLDLGTHADTVDLDKRDAFRRGLRGTPSFLINDQPLIGANPTLMVQMIDSIIASQQ